MLNHRVIVLTFHAHSSVDVAVLVFVTGSSHRDARGERLVGKQ